MRVNMNKTEVMISGEWQKVTRKEDCKIAMWCLW